MQRSLWAPLLTATALACSSPQLNTGTPEETPEDAGFFIPQSDGGLTLGNRDASVGDAARPDAAVGLPDASVGLDAGTRPDAAAPPDAAVPDAAQPPDAGRGPTTFTQDLTQSLVYVQVFKNPNTALASQSHDHVVRASTFSATLTYNPDATTGCSVVFSLPVSGLINDEPNMRQLVGYPGNLSAADRQTVSGHMRAENQLDEANFPTMSFTSTQCSGPGGTTGTLSVTGTLNIHGRDRATTAMMEFLTDGTQIRARGSFEANQTDFGITPYSAFLGAVANLDGMRFTLDVVAVAP